MSEKCRFHQRKRFSVRKDVNHFPFMFEAFAKLHLNGGAQAQQSQPNRKAETHEKQY